MSGIIGSRFNSRGSGLVGSLGTDGQVFTSAGAGQGIIPEDAGGGAWTLIKTITASSDSTISFVNGASSVVLDSTYDEYCFRFINIHCSDHETDLRFNMSIDGGSNYNVAKTSSAISIYHKEDDSGTPQIVYSTGIDLANATGAQRLAQNIGIENDESASGYLHLFAPASTTFKKHFVSRANMAEAYDYSEGNDVWGFVNSTSAVNAVQFSMSSGNIDTGKIKLYGIS